MTPSWTVFSPSVSSARSLGNSECSLSQRGYRWDNEQVLQLLDDIHGSSGPYYLQPIVVKPLRGSRLVVQSLCGLGLVGGGPV